MTGVTLTQTQPLTRQKTMEKAMEKPCGCGGSKPRAPERHPCTCDCPECRAECCDLECLVHPRFYCGQLLTDQDLTLLVDWIKNKTALSRHRHGWGVVCGLDVVCEECKEHPARVRVTPGYAITCCGDDVVVCADACVDLEACCKPEQEPCEDLKPEDRGKGRKPIVIAGKQFDPAEIVALDLYIQYRQDLSEPQAAISQRGCHTSQHCEYGRVEESHSFCLRRVDDFSETPDWYSPWKKTYEEMAERLLRLLEGAPEDPEDAARRLLAWIEKYPLHQFCHLARTICEHQFEPYPIRGEKEEGNEFEQRVHKYRAEIRAWFEQMWFWISQDWRNHYFRCACGGCQEDFGVPLARIFLQKRKARTGRLECCVVAIDPYPPYRRPIRLDCLPAPEGSINLSDLIWQPVESSCAVLAGRGIKIAFAREFQVNEAWRLKQPPLVELCAPRPEGSWVGIFTRTDTRGRNRIVTIEPWVNPARLRLESLEGVREGRATRLQSEKINDVVDLANADRETIVRAFKGIPGNQEDDAIVLIERARESLAKLRSEDPNFRPMR